MRLLTQIMMCGRLDKIGLAGSQLKIHVLPRGTVRLLTQMTTCGRLGKIDSAGTDPGDREMPGADS
jgi:hypothetical protein